MRRSECDVVGFSLVCIVVERRFSMELWREKLLVFTTTAYEISRKFIHVIFGENCVVDVTDFFQVDNCFTFHEHSLHWLIKK